MSPRSERAVAHSERMRDLEERRRLAEQRRVRRVVAVSAVVAVLVMVPAVVLLLGERGPRSVEPEPIDGVVELAVAAGGPVVGAVDYAQTPPVGGDFSSSPMACDFYAEPVPPERAVASLARGAVWVTFDPELPAREQELLQALAGAHDFLLVSPVTGLPSAVVASAWGLQLQLDDPSDERLEQFLDAYQRGPQALIPAESCTQP